MPPTQSKEKNNGSLNVPATQLLQQQAALTVDGYEPAVLLDRQLESHPSNQSTASINRVADTVLNSAKANWPTVIPTPGFTFEHVQAVQNSSWRPFTGPPPIQQDLTSIGKRRYDAIYLDNKLESNTCAQNVAANASLRRQELFRKTFAQANASLSTKESPVPPSRPNSVATVFVHTEGSQKPSSGPNLGTRPSNPGQQPAFNRVTSKLMAHDHQSRPNVGEGMRVGRRDEFEGTNIIPPMFRDEYIKSDADGSSTGAASTTAEGNGNNSRAPGRQSADASQPITGVLPVEKSFPIQIGSELFRLSGASIMSDGQ